MRLIDQQFDIGRCRPLDSGDQIDHQTEACARQGADADFALDLDRGWREVQDRFRPVAAGAAEAGGMAAGKEVLGCPVPGRPGPPIAIGTERLALTMPFSFRLWPLRLPLAIADIAERTFGP